MTRIWDKALFPLKMQISELTFRILREGLAASLRGRLSLPEASWKYAWIEKLFGFVATKHTQFVLQSGQGFCTKNVGPDDVFPRSSRRFVANWSRCRGQR